MATIAIIGTFDTKGQEHQFLAEALKRLGKRTILIDVGTGKAPSIQPDITRHEVAQAAGLDLDTLMQQQDRGLCVEGMAGAIPILMKKLVNQGTVQGVIAMGGGGGTSIATAAMRALPLGLPKLMISTMAGGNVTAYIGTSDILMMPSIVDVSGLNRILCGVIERGAAAMSGMVEAAAIKEPSSKPTIVASMFGNTTGCVEMAREQLEAAGYEVLVFHATGTGGRAMESLIESGLVDGVLDITATEWADEMLGGVLSAGPHRHEAAGRTGIPTIIAPGCLDMVNFHAPETIPDHFQGRRFYVHNPQVTLMRTTPSECAKLGKLLADKINAYTGPVTVLLPLEGISVISAPGGPFHDPQADQQLFESLRSHLRKDIPILEIKAQINELAFAQACCKALLEHMA
ncbi:MAG: Tm-1-like ATP-binding domain-containing protein [Verrucomicrobiota bacterium]